MPIVGQHLRDARIKHEFYRIMMADALNIPYEKIEKIEKGEVDISYDLICKWCKALNEDTSLILKEINNDCEKAENIDRPFGSSKIDEILDMFSAQKHLCDRLNKEN